MGKITLGDIKHSELNVLIKFHNFCEKHHLYYTLAGGTLLGAIRHKGFIPWDDDIDVMMPRSDYQKLLYMVKNGKTDNNPTFLLPGEGGNVCPFIKAVDPNIIAHSVGGLSDIPLSIDVFPLDNLPEDDQELGKFFKKARVLRASIIAYDADLKVCKVNLKYFAKIILKVYVKVVGLKRIIKRIDEFSQTYNDRNTGYIGGIMWGYGVGERMKIESYMHNVSVEFEGNSFNAPSCWKNYLTGLYGDYMQLPPKEKRKSHEIKAWYVNKEENK